MERLHDELLTAGLAEDPPRARSRDDEEECRRVKKAPEACDQHQPVQLLDMPKLMGPVWEAWIKRRWVPAPRASSTLHV